MGTRVNYGGIVIAGIGFFATRFTVTLGYADPLAFYFAGLLPLALGLGLAAFGVALAVADVDPALVRTTALWCALGAVTMLVLVALTLLGSTAGDVTDLDPALSRTYLSNFLVGGSVGGTLTGLYAARNRQQRRELRRQASRLTALNRLLRHEVLNAVAVIRGYASTPDVDDAEAETVIAEQSRAIEATIEDVKHLIWSAESDATAGVPTDLDACLSRSVEAVTDRHPAATISITGVPEGSTVRGDDRLEQVFEHLLENAVIYGGEDATVEVTVTETADAIRVSVSDEGPGLPESQQRLLEAGELSEFDDPGSGFGLNVVRLLVEGYGGSIETDVDGGGTTITVALQRPENGVLGFERGTSGLAGVRPAVPHLVVTLGAAVVAGVPYGLVAEQLGGSVAAIGVFYGTPDPVVGWLTHEFHSVVFGFTFAGLLSLAPERYRDRVLFYLASGTAWGICLWVVAAGFVAPIWLRLLGTPVPVPSFSATLLWSHLAWGSSLGLLTAVGYEHVTPSLARLGERVRSVS